MMGDVLLVGVGGFLGANCRYFMVNAVAARIGTAFPYGTLLVNVAGSFAIGALLAFLDERTSISPAWRLLLAVGFLGGYTTFSSYSFEAVGLADQGLWLRALAYVAASNAACLAACFLGVALARAIDR
jgi:fluoride exporter